MNLCKKRPVLQNVLCVQKYIDAKLIFLDSGGFFLSFVFSETSHTILGKILKTEFGFSCCTALISETGFIMIFRHKSAV